MSRVQDVKKSSLTFAPEAGSQRLRNVINKGLTEENTFKWFRRGVQGRLEPRKALLHAGTSDRDSGRYAGYCRAFGEGGGSVL